MFSLRACRDEAQVLRGVRKVLSLVGVAHESDLKLPQARVQLHACGRRSLRTKLYGGHMQVPCGRCQPHD